jgi:hypothetical protein
MGDFYSFLKNYVINWSDVRTMTVLCLFPLRMANLKMLNMAARWCLIG